MAVDPALPPAMSAAEQDLLRAAVAGRQAGLEFGCGGSTGLLLAAGLARLDSVDSDAGWLQRVAAAPDCGAALAAGRLRLRHIDLGPLGPWGAPRDTSRLAYWPAYWRDPWDLAGEVDFVLVDGRFRVACALQAAVRLAAGGLLAVHDFWPRQAYQPPILRHHTLLGSAGSLALFAPRQPADAALLAADLVAHALDYR
jgi:hypothetical protein